MKRRLATIILALLLAGVGTIGVAAYVKQANNRALQGEEAETVLVAKGDIPAGTKLTSAMVKPVRVAAYLTPPGEPLTTLTGLTALTTNVNIAADQTILKSMLGAATSNGASGPPAGDYEYSANFCLSQVVAGNIHVGSILTAFYTTATTGTLSQSNCGATAQSATGISTKMLGTFYVVGIGPAGAKSSGSSGGGTLGQSNSGTTLTGESSVLLTLASTQTLLDYLIKYTATGLVMFALPTSALPGTAADPQN